MKWFLTTCAIAFLVVGLAVAYMQNTNSIAVYFSAFVVLLIIANLDRISEFKAGKDGIEGKTRDIIRQAENAVDEIKILALQVATLSLSLVKRSGRLGGYSDAEADSIKESMLGILRQLRATHDEQLKVLEGWHDIEELDYIHLVLGGHTIPDGVSSEVTEEWKRLRRVEPSEVTPRILRAFLTEHDLLSEAAGEWLTDYEHFRSKRDHRRPLAWQHRQNVERLAVQHPEG